MARESQPTLLKLFRDAVFEIPQYQRGYAWKKQHVQDLLVDLDHQYQDKKQFEREHRDNDGGLSKEYDGFHYFGTVVLHKTGVESGRIEDFTKYDIIDGQQRITTITVLASCIVNRLGNMDFGDGSLQTEAQETADELERVFLRAEVGKRLRPDQDLRTFYNLLVMSHDERVESRANSPYEKNLLTAYKTIEDWLDDKEDVHEESFLDFVADIIKILREYFIITKFTVDRPSDAGRFFEVLNDRGRDLTTIDKIKGYLIYSAARMDDDDLAEDIYNVIGDVVDGVGQVGGESKVNTFIREHWRMYTGEYRFDRGSDEGPSDIHRRIKQLDSHIPQYRDAEGKKRWIKRYINSLAIAAEEFRQIESPNILKTQSNEDTDLVDQTVEALKSFNSTGKRRNFLSILMAGKLQFGVSPEFLCIVEQCRTLSFRLYRSGLYNVTKRRPYLQQLAFPTAWAGNWTECAAVFGEDHTPVEREIGRDRDYQNKQEAFQGLHQRLENQIGKYADDSTLEDILRKPNVISGGSGESWNGLKRRGLFYILYEYEKNQGSDDRSLADFSDFVKGLEVEHIWSQTPKQEDIEGRKDEHRRYVNSLGNLAFLTPDDNKTADNQSYRDKFDQVYSLSDNILLSELPPPDDIDEWGAQTIEERCDRLVEFVLRNWSGLVTAHVNMNLIPDDLEKKEFVRKEIRQDCKEHLGFRVGHVHLYEDRADLPASGIELFTVSECDCGSTQTKIATTTSGLQAIGTGEGDERQILACAECDDTLSRPAYKISKNPALVEAVEIQ